jgi:VWFA-related protein
VLCLGLVSFSARAEFLTNWACILSATSASPEVAVPRPIKRLQPGHDPYEGSSPEGILHETQSNGGTVPSGRPSAERITEKPLPKEPVGWNGRRVTVLGIDRTEFPEIMVLFELRDNLGQPIASIDPSALHLSEDEAPQHITGVAPSVPEHIPGDPLSIAILIDTSGSMQPYIDVVQNAASRFAQRLREDDQATVITFCNQPVLVQPLTNSQKKIQKAIYKAYPRGFTALYDSVHMGVQSLQGCVGRKALVVVTDGRDDDGTGAELSRTPKERVITAANDARIPIFIIGLGEEIGRPVLERMADETGGDFHYAPSGGDVDRLYRDVAERLGRGDSGYYTLTYRASEGEKDGSSRTMVIRYQDALGVASYPAPKRLFWPLSKVF